MPSWSSSHRDTGFQVMSGLLILWPCAVLPGRKGPGPAFRPLPCVKFVGHSDHALDLTCLPHFSVYSAKALIILPWHPAHLQMTPSLFNPGPYIFHVVVGIHFPDALQSSGVFNSLKYRLQFFPIKFYLIHFLFPLLMSLSDALES